MITTRKFTFIGICILLVSTFFLYSPFVDAQEGLALKVQPSTIDEKVDPGQSVEGVLTITNQNGGRQTYYISARNITGMNEVGTPIFEEEYADDPLEAAAWVKPSLSNVTLDVGESITVPYRIDVPENASPGSYFAAFFVTREAEETNESGAGVGFHVASLINLRVNGPVNDDMIFRVFSTVKRFFTKPDVTFNIRVDNVGTIHQRPSGIIIIYDMLGNEVGEVRFNEKRGAILPRHHRIFDTTWTHDGFAIGKYTAQASILIGDEGKRTVTKEQDFWIIPVKELGILVGTIILVLFGFIFGIKVYIKSVLRKVGQGELPKNDKKHLTLAKKMIRTITWIIGLIVILFIGVIVFS